MAIYDCFQFFNEEEILDIRLNILSPFVDYFVIVESSYDHQGNKRELVFNKKKFEKFSHKINYIIVNDVSHSIIKRHQGGHSLIEQHQRNAIMKGLEKSSDSDLIIIHLTTLINNNLKADHQTIHSELKIKSKEANKRVTDALNAKIEYCVCSLRQFIVTVTPFNLNCAYDCAMNLFMQRFS